MPDYVRVRTAAGEATVRRHAAEADGLTILDKPAVHPSGSPLPFKPRVPKGRPVAATTPFAEADASEVQED